MQSQSCSFCYAFFMPIPLFIKTVYFKRKDFSMYIGHFSLFLTWFITVEKL